MAKKTKKIETPIDQRETFVSIQKSFADSDLSVEEKLKTLYALQQADTEIDKILQLRGELPLEVEGLEHEIADLKAKTARINEMIDDAGKRILEYKHNIVECDAQLEKYKAQVDNVANSREYDSLNKEIEKAVKENTKKCLEKGHKQGQREGRKEAAMDNARTMIADGSLPLSKIAKFSGLSIGEVESIKNSIKA